MLRRKGIVCESKTLEAQGLSIAPPGPGEVLGARVPRATRWPSAPACLGLDYAGLSGLGFDALPVYVTFDCTLAPAAGFRGKKPL